MIGREGAVVVGGSIAAVKYIAIQSALNSDHHGNMKYRERNVSRPKVWGRYGAP